MSFKIGGFLNLSGSSNQISGNAVNPPVKPTGNDKYTGGIIQIPTSPGETPQTVSNRGLYEHAKRAGLDTVPLKAGDKSAGRSLPTAGR